MCVHCLLPLGRRFVSAAVDGQSHVFCCYGCALAMQVTRARGEGGVAAALLVRLGLAIFFAMNVMMVSMPTWAPYIYADLAPGGGPFFQVLRLLAMAFAAPVLVLLGWPILRAAVSGLRRGSANTDALIVLGTLAAYLLSAINTLRGEGAVYFETAAMLLVLVTLGRYLEARLKAEAGAAVQATLAPVPAGALRCRDDASTESVPPSALGVGDVVRVRPGDAFPTDGVVTEGVGGVDEAAITGENRPVLKEPGDAIAGGTCSVDGVFKVRVTRPAAQSAAARIAELLAQARRERSPAERLADGVAAVLVPVVVAIALSAGVYWTLRVGPDCGLLTALAVLVVACPCGLGIATPVAVWSGLVAAARHGVIVRRAAVIERAAKVRRVLFDKTGTLTERTPQLTAIEPASDSGLVADEVLMRAAALEAELTHPLAYAIADGWRAHASAPLPAASDVRIVPGRGVHGRVAGQECTAGSVRFAIDELGEDRLRPYLRADDMVVAVWKPGLLLGVLRFVEKPRPEASQAFRELQVLGVHPGLLSGDTQASAVVPSLLPARDAALGLLPEQKVEHILRLARGPRRQQTTHDKRTPTETMKRAKASVDRNGTLAMVGDGINDAPALAAADVGIAVGAASDLTRMSADVAIVSEDLRRVPWLLAHARGVTRVIRQNLFWAFAYNAAAVTLAAAGRLNPLVASLAMIGSSVVVVANARRAARSWQR